MTQAGAGTRCIGSFVRFPISVGDEVARRTRCPRCGRILRIRPTRKPSGQFAKHFTSGNPTATLPAHLAAAKGA
jgi:hypothetical protein